MNPAPNSYLAPPAATLRRACVHVGKGPLVRFWKKGQLQSGNHHYNQRPGGKWLNDMPSKKFGQDVYWRSQNQAPAAGM